MSGSSWKPILVGELAKKALSVVEEIGESLSESEIFWDPEGTGSRESKEGPGLAGGLSGLAVFHAYLAKHKPGAGHEETAQHLLEASESAVENAESQRPAFYGGYTGVGWAREQLVQLLGIEQGELNEQWDGLLLDQARELQAPADYDLVSGCAGWGIYAVERISQPSAAESAEALVDWFDRNAERNEAGITWFTDPSLLPEHQRKECPNGYYNLGLAHGVPGVITFLSGVCAAGVAKEKARPLLEGAVSWLLVQEMKDNPVSRFTYWLAPGIEPQKSRSAWCYGDPGVFSALYCAAQATGNKSWEKKAIEIAKLAASLPAEQSGVVDAGLCHGAAGLAQVFNRLYQSSGEEKLRQAARFWCEHTLNMRKPGEGLAGYSARRVGEDGEPYWEPEKGILEGAAGIALTLLSAATSIDPAWDRMLGISLPRKLEFSDP